ncbi:hypothetical protein [Geminocystis sp. NIES-3709]|uniref:hypothetical protein n=1 Tax=Geminocystis sp. NIES-3709 TaxID=1617448 RepID=UPI0005FC7063|nr:hypothetical protein [Geminocystis sp. NIES-3709]BAQ67085.1 hypothetical protein GM3709_3850 [Geminocystis sp. NIES-3709]
MVCYYCQEKFGRGMPKKTEHKDKLYHADCLQQYLSVQAYYAEVNKAKEMCNI